MMNEAIKKLEDEMNNEASNAYVQYVGPKLIEHIRQHPESSEMFMTEGLTIKGSLKKMRDEASKVKVDNVAMFTLDQGMKIVFDYFGVEIGSQADLETLNASVSVKSSKLLDINIDELF